MFFELIVGLLLVAWWLTGSYWPIFPLWAGWVVLLKFGIYGEVLYPTKLALVALIVGAFCIACAPRWFRYGLRRNKERNLRAEVVAWLQAPELRRGR